MQAKAVLGVMVSAALVWAAAATAAEFVPPALVTGADTGGGAHIRGWSERRRELPVSFMAFSGNSGGVRVATADVDGDGRPEILAAPGSSGSEIKVFGGRTYALLHRFLPYYSWGSGVFVAGGDVNGDGKAEVVAGTGPGCCTSARFFSVSPSRELAGFFLYESSAEVGARVALADFTGDGRAELAALPVRGSATGRVGLYAVNGDGKSFRSFQAFAGASNTALAAGDVTGDARAEVVVSAVGGAGAQIKVLDATNGRALLSLVPYLAAPPSELAVAVGDVDGDGRGDVVTAAQTSEGLAVRAFDATGRQLASFFALDPDQRETVSVAAADLDGDERAEIVLGTGPTMDEPRIAVFDGVGRAVGAFSFDEPFFFGGVRVALGNVLGGLRPEVVTAPGPGRPAEIRLYDPEYDFDGNLLRSFLPYGSGFANGLHVAAADTQGDRHAEIVVGPGAGIEPRVKILDGDGRELSSFLAFETEFRGGVRVAAGDLDADGKAEIVAARASGPAQVRVFEATGDALTTVVSLSGDSGAEIGVADLEGDGRSEILISDPAGVFQGILVADPFSASLDQLHAADPGARLAGIDIDGDGRDEIVAVHGGRLFFIRGHDIIGDFTPYPWATVDVFAAAVVPAGPALAIDRRTFRGFVGTPLRREIAVFRDAAGRGSAEDFSATVDWGDDAEPSRGVVVPRGGGRFAVTGMRTYFSPGTYRIAVMVTDARGRTVRTTSVVRVALAPLRVTPAAAIAFAGHRSRLVLGRVGLFNLWSRPERFRLTISWGDGTRSAGVFRDGGASFDIVGEHRYRRAGTFRVVVQIAAKDGSRRAVVRTVVRVRPG